VANRAHVHVRFGSGEYFLGHVVISSTLAGSVNFL
jgi:hypothetical protein